MQPFERNRQEPCVIRKRGKLQLRFSKYGMKESGEERHFQPCSLRASARRKINVLFNFIGFL